MSTGASAAGRPKPGLLTNTEVADYLSVELRHIRRLVHEKRISYINWGQLLRFDRRPLRLDLA